MKETCIKDAIGVPYRLSNCAARVGPTPAAPGNLSEGVTAKRDKVRHLLWINAISLPDLFGPDARKFTTPRRVKDRCASRGELKKIPIAAGHNGSAVRTLLSSNGSGEKVVRFVSGRFGVRKPKRGYKFRQDIELFDHFLIELAPALVGGKHFVTLCRRVQAVPSDNNGARPLIRVEPQQEIGEAKDGARRLAVAAANGFRQRVV